MASAGNGHIARAYPLTDSGIDTTTLEFELADPSMYYTTRDTRIVCLIDGVLVAETKYTVRQPSYTVPETRVFDLTTDRNLPWCAVFRGMSIPTNAPHYQGGQILSDTLVSTNGWTVLDTARRIAYVVDPGLVTAYAYDLVPYQPLLAISDRWSAPNAPLRIFGARMHHGRGVVLNVSPELAASGASLDVRLFDLGGRQLARTVATPDNRGTLTLSIAPPPGLYIVRARAGDRQVAANLVRW
jgi:hypothetical protein